MRTTIRRSAWGVTAAVMLAVGLAACGGGDDSSSSTVGEAPTELQNSGSAEGPTSGAADRVETADRATQAPASPTTAPVAPGGGEGAAQGVPPALQPIDIGRSIIFTATVNVEVDNVATASNGAMQAIAGLGGFLYGQQATTEPVPTNVLTFKVAPKDFQEALTRLGGLGTIQNQVVSTDDVTERVVDLESRVQAAQVSVDRLRGFLSEATNVNDLAALERELLNRESELEQLKGQLRTIQSQVDLATITLTLTQAAPDGPAAEITVTAYPGADEGTVSCPGDDELTVTEGDRMTVCYEVHNTGSLALSELRIDDRGLDLATGDLTVVQGDLDAALEPDQVIVLAAVVDASLDNRPAPRLRAVPLDADGEPVRTQIQVTMQNLELSVDEDTSLPGFVTALKAGWGALAFLGSLVLLFAGALIPFVWLVPLCYFAARWLRKRRAAREAARLAAMAPPHAPSGAGGHDASVPPVDSGGGYAAGPPASPGPTVIAPGAQTSGTSSGSTGVAVEDPPGPPTR